MEEFCGSVFWDSDLTWYTPDPDFTPCFLKTVLVYAPCVFLVVFAPLDIHYARISKYADIPWSWNNCTRLLLNVLLIAVAVADIIVAATWEDGIDQFDVHLVTPAVKIVTFLITSGLILMHRKRGVRSSGLLFLFWLLLAVLAIPQFRHEIRQFERRTGPTTIGTDHLSWADFQFVSNIIYSSFVFVQLIVHLFVDAVPRTSRYDPLKQENPCPELRASFFNRILFAWFDPLTWKGYKRPLVGSDLWDINPSDTTEAMSPKFDRFWRMNVAKNEKASARKPQPTTTKANDKTPKSTQRLTKGNIMPVLFQTFGPQFYLAGFLKLIIDLLSFAPPQILRLMIAFTVDQAVPMWHGIVFSLTLLFISLLSALLNQQHAYFSALVGYRIRTVLISAIYRKSLHLSNTARRETTVGELVNLMSVDAQRFLELIPFLHLAWSAPLVIAICMYFLYEVLGVAALAGLAVLFLMIPFSAYVATKLKSFQIRQMKKKDERIKMMNEILSGIKVLKLYAWEPSFEAAVSKTREEELRIIKYAGIANSFVFLQFNMLPMMVTLVSYLVFMFVDPENNKITPSSFFVSLSLFNILRQPMTMLPMMVTQMMQGWVAVRRINKYLNYEDLDPQSVSNEPDSRALTIANGTFTWGEEDGVVLADVNMQVPKGEMAAVVGPVGCGKSSLVFSLLGDTKKLQGTVNIDGSMAYVAQQAWIQNATLQENILFGLPMEPAFYKRVLDACALTSDLQILPGGDQTEIGEKGINLSGGQKQRVALARAVYARADIYLLDDPLSAVDSHVGKHIFENVIGPSGMLAGRTRLLVTHGISFLPQTDNIYVLKDGVISESGTYATLLEQKGAFADFLEQHLQNVDEDDEEELEAIKQALESTKAGAKLFERAISVRNSLPKKKNSVTSSSKGTLSKKIGIEVLSEQPEPEPIQNKGTTLIQTEISAVGGVGIKVYIRYFQSVGWFLSALTLGGGILYQGLSIFSNQWLSQWSNHETANEPATRDLYLGLYGGLAILSGAALFLSSTSMTFGCLYASRMLQYNLLHRTLRLPMSFFDTTPAGRILNRFTKDVDIVDNILPQLIRAWMIMFFSTIGILIVISISTPIFMAVIVPLAIFYFFIQRFYVATARQLKRIESVTRSPIYSHFGETITGQTTIRAYRVQDRFRLTSEKHVDLNQQYFFPALVSARWLGVRLESIGALVLLFAALFAVLARETISSELVGLSITYALQITSTLAFLLRLTAELETNIVANERLEEYSSEQTEAAWETEHRVDKAWPVEGCVQFSNVELRYREGLDLVLRGITFDIRGGEKIGIVGRTGAGKSSLTLALFRLIEAAGGQITIDGQPIAAMGLQELRSRLTIIPQDPVLFSGTLRMNVDPFDVYSDEDIWKALEHAHLKAFVKGTSAGLAYEVAEGGDNLSIGQRQLVCLARALLRKTKVLVLDEATAAIDLETDDLIQTTIRQQFSDCTVLTIAHRLNTILDSDRVLVLDKGLVAELDTPQNLLSNKQSIFYGMAKDAGLTGAN